MAEKEHYVLQKGDYIQSGDEAFNEQLDRWFSIPKEYFGRQWGGPLHEGEGSWAPCRRLVPENFKQQKKLTIMIQDQWGSEFEL